MFYLNSEDTTIVPDSLFFLHRLGLLEHKSTRKLPVDCPYYMESAKPCRLFTASEALQNPEIVKSQAVLITDFVNDEQIAALGSQKILVLAHVYFDYVLTIKSLYSNPNVSDLKILVPDTKNNLLIPKKHLQMTLSFLEESDFLEWQDFKVKPAKSGSPFSLSAHLDKLTLGIKWALSGLIFFFAKPSVNLKLFITKPFINLRLFFAKYNFKYIFGSTRVFSIKLFYGLINQRFSLMRSWSALRRWLGLGKVGLIKLFYLIINIRFSASGFLHRILRLRYDLLAAFGFMKVTAIDLFYGIINRRFAIYSALRRALQLRYDLVSAFGFMKVGTIRTFYALINLRFALMSAFHRIINVRYNLFSAAGTIKVASIKLFYGIINLRFKLIAIPYFFVRIFNAVRIPAYYSSIKLFHTVRIAFIRLFFMSYNLRFPLARYLNRAYWFNFNYTLYPLRKLYWVLEHETNKRIISKFNATKN